MMRLLHPDGAIFYNHKWRLQNGLLQDRADIVDEFSVRHILIWEMSGGINYNPGYFLPNFAVIYLIAKPVFVLTSKADAVGCALKINRESDNEHLAPFSVELTARCIDSVRPGPVLDRFTGSGATAVAVEQIGVDCSEIEVSSEYAEMTDRLRTPHQEPRAPPGGGSPSVQTRHTWWPRCSVQTNRASYFGQYPKRQLG